MLIQHLYGSTGLAGIVLAMAIESCCIPLPSEIVMPLAGGLIASSSALPGTNPAWPAWVNLLLIALSGAIGCLIGSAAAYGIGYTGGRPLMLKYGRYLLISQHDADKADSFFKRWGSATAFFSRLLPVVRTYISLPAGISKMPFGKFCVYTFLGSFPWCLLLAYVGFLLGNNLGTLGPIFHNLDIVILVVIVVLVILYVWRHISNDRKARATLAALAPEVAATPSASGPMQGQPPSQQGWDQQPQFLAQQNQSWGQPAPGQFSAPPQPASPAQQSWSQPLPPQPQQSWSQPASGQFQTQQNRGQQQQFPAQQSQSPQPQVQQQQPFPPQQQQGWGQQRQFLPQQGWGQPPRPQQPWPSPTENDGRG